SVGVCGIANKRDSSAKRLSSVIGRSPHHLSANITRLNRSRGCALKEMLALRFQLAHLRRSFPMAGQTTVAVIGLGSMGLGMARSMLKAGHRVYGFDINPGALAALREDGGLAASTPADAAGDADIVIIVVVNATQTESVLFGEAGVVCGMKPGAVIVSCATISPSEAKCFAARTEAAGLLYLDGPISGGSKKASSGELTFMASGSAQAFKAARPALDAMAGTVYELGDHPGV